MVAPAITEALSLYDCQRISQQPQTPSRAKLGRTQPRAANHDGTLIAWIAMDNASASFKKRLGELLGEPHRVSQRAVNHGNSLPTPSHFWTGRERRIEVFLN
jgi:hypothetical protein